MTLPNGWRKWPDEKPEYLQDVWVIAYGSKAYKTEYLPDMTLEYWQPYSVPAGPDDVKIVPSKHDGDTGYELVPDRAKQLWMREV